VHWQHVDMDNLNTGPGTKSFNCSKFVSASDKAAHTLSAYHNNRSLHIVILIRTLTLSRSAASELQLESTFCQAQDHLDVNVITT
jgi:hypothetical protein